MKTLDSTPQSNQKAALETKCIPEEQREYLFNKLSTELQECKRQLSKQTYLLTEKENELLEVYKTKSWKLTKPLRDLNLLRKKIRSFFSSVNSFNDLKKQTTIIIKKSYRKGYKILRRLKKGYKASYIIGSTQEEYLAWISGYEKLTEKEEQEIFYSIKNFNFSPKFSIIMPVFDPPIEYLTEAINSVIKQSYPKWELCIADDASTNPQICELLKGYSTRDQRIKTTFRTSNGHISKASNSALAMATGDYVVLLDHDDLLADHALYWVAREINKHPDTKLIYSDEDKVDSRGQRFGAYFKCDWNLDLLLSQNMFSHLGVYSHDLVKSVGGFRVGFEGSQDYDLVLRCLKFVKESQIRHIPKVLYHWRAIEGSTAKDLGEKDYAKKAGKRALNSYLRNNSIPALATSVFSGYRVKYQIPKPRPKVSLIILTKNNFTLLQRCVESILQKTRYPDYEIIIVDNGSDDLQSTSYLQKLKQHRRFKVVRDERPFNYSALNNLAANLASGEILGLLNDDTEVIRPGWMRELVSHACRPQVGAVGALLLFPDHTIQHAGVILGIDKIAAHAHKHYSSGEPGYFGRASLIQSFSAVTGACLFVKKELYTLIGGLNEADLSVAFNDLDFCLRLQEKGYKTVWTPYAELIHYESASRGSDQNHENRERFSKEIIYMKSQWGKIIKNDPFYNPNLTLNNYNFSLAIPPREQQP